LRSAPELNSAR